MATLHIPTPLRPYTEGQSTIELDGKNIAAILSRLVEEFPAVRPYIYDEQDQLRPYVNMFLNGEDVRNLQGDETPVGKDDKVRIVPSIAGGVLDEVIMKKNGRFILGLDSQNPWPYTETT